MTDMQISSYSLEKRGIIQDKDLRKISFTMKGEDGVASLYQFCISAEFLEKKKKQQGGNQKLQVVKKGLGFHIWQW